MSCEQPIAICQVSSVVRWPGNSCQTNVSLLGWQALTRARSMQLRCQNGVYEGVLVVLGHDVLTSCRALQLPGGRAEDAGGAAQAVAGGAGGSRP